MRAQHVIYDRKPVESTPAPHGEAVFRSALHSAQWQGRIHDPGDAMLKSVKSLKIEIDKYCTDLQNTKELKVWLKLSKVIIHC